MKSLFTLQTIQSQTLRNLIAEGSCAGSIGANNKGSIKGIRRPHCTRIGRPFCIRIERPFHAGYSRLFHTDIQRSFSTGHSRKLEEQTWQRARNQFSIWNYTELSKFKLTCFVLLTTMAGYALAPGAASISNLLWTTVGTGLCVASANSINQWTEIPYDSQMARTRNRVLVRHSMTPAHAFLFGGISGIAGTALLATVSPVSAALGCANIFLYTCVYTPMKRTSIYNTWPGAIVGAIPPIIGWTACSGSIDAGAILLALSLYSWQFPHFNSLSWNLRPDYSKAGYMMMSVLDPYMNARVSFRYAMTMFPISLAFYGCDVTSWWFLIDSSLINGYMGWYAFQFWRESTDARARSLFFSSLVHLPIFLILLMLHKTKETKESKINV